MGEADSVGDGFVENLNLVMAFEGRD